MKKFSFFLSLVFAFTSVSCVSTRQLEKSTDYTYKYEVAKQYFAEGKYNSAANLLQEVITMFKGTNKGEESLFLLGMSNLNARNYDAATATLRKYYQTYPRGIYAEEARFYAGKALYLSTPETRLDQTPTYDALNELNEFIEVFPESSLRNDAAELIFELQDALVEKEYHSAMLYYKLGDYFLNCMDGGSNYQACIITSENAIREYPYTTRREDFSVLILKSKFELAHQSVEEKKEERFHSAIDEYYGFINEYPESKNLQLAHDLYKNVPRQYKTATSDQE